MGLTMDSGAAEQSTADGIAGCATVHVVYNTRTGEILHIHHSVVFANDVPARETAEARALRFAPKAEDLAVLQVDPSEVDHPEPMRVDPASRVVLRG
jgi:hypothetical protein